MYFLDLLRQLFPIEHIFFGAETVRLADVGASVSFIYNRRATETLRLCSPPIDTHLSEDVRVIEGIPRQPARQIDEISTRHSHVDGREREREKETRIEISHVVLIRVTYPSFANEQSTTSSASYVKTDVT